MAAFELAFQAMIKAEGGYTLHNIKGDRGGVTFAGIARNFHPDWRGWGLIDAGTKPYTPKLLRAVEEFYKLEYWEPLKADQISNQKIATSIFDFGVNAGINVSAKLTQISVGAHPDGHIGPKTLEALNTFEPVIFSLRFFAAKVTRYTLICTKKPKQKKFLLGWINRALERVKWAL